MCVHEMQINRCQLDLQSFSTLQWLLPDFIPTLDIGVLKQTFFFKNSIPFNLIIWQLFLAWLVGLGFFFALKRLTKSPQDRKQKE